MIAKTTLVESSYEGWVAWTGGYPVRMPDGTHAGYNDMTPILEAVAHNPFRVNLLGGVPERAPRPVDHRTMDWNDLPHGDVRVLELYAFRRRGREQPVISIAMAPGKAARWIQYKKTGIIAQTASLSGDARADDKDVPGGVARLGIQSWVVGYWHFDGLRGEAKIFEYGPSGVVEGFEYEGRNHPCWPRPLGFGMSPHVLGLKPEDVPPSPMHLMPATLSEV